MQYQGQPIEVEYTEHYPPDTQAASLWLRNRQPGKWRDVQTPEHDHTGTVTMSRAELNRQAQQKIVDTFGPLLEHQPQPGE